MPAGGGEKVRPGACRFAPVKVSWAKAQCAKGRLAVFYAKPTSGGRSAVVKVTFEDEGVNPG